MALKISTNKAASSDGDKGDAKNKISELAKGLTTGASELAKNTAGIIQSVDIKKIADDSAKNVTAITQGTAGCRSVRGELLSRSFPPTYLL